MNDYALAFGHGEVIHAGNILWAAGVSAVPLTQKLGVELDKIEISDLGQAKLIHIDNDNTTIIEGAGETKAIQGRIAQIRREIDITTSDYDKEKLSSLAQEINKRRGTAREVWVIFDNTAQGFATGNALQLMNLVH